MSRDTFDRIVNLLADNLIFQSQGRKPQRHVKFQLAAFLLRYGRRGSDAFVVSRDLGIGAGTVFLYCQRVSRALRQLQPQFLGWPDEDRKTVISTAISEQSGFDYCLGSGDGSLIRFSEEPMTSGWLFRCRKKFYAVSIVTTEFNRSLLIFKIIDKYSSHCRP